MSVVVWMHVLNARLWYPVYRDCVYASLLMYVGLWLGRSSSIREPGRHAPERAQYCEHVQRRSLWEGGSKFHGQLYVEKMCCWCPRWEYVITWLFETVAAVCCSAFLCGVTTQHLSGPRTSADLIWASVCGLPETAASELCTHEKPVVRITVPWYSSEVEDAPINAPCWEIREGHTLMSQFYRDYAMHAVRL